MKRLLFFVLLGLMLPLLAAKPLFADKKTAWQIIIAPEATSTEVRGAEELQHFLKRVSGADFAIKRTAKIPAENAIVIGTAESLPALPPAVKDFPEGVSGNDSLRVKSLSGNLYLTGNVPRGALYAVYTFLKNYLGVRWVFAGKDGEFVPPRIRFELPEVDVYEVAKFKYRGFHVCGSHYNKDMETWMSRNKINIMRSDPIGKHKWRRAWNDSRIAKGLHMMFSTHNITIRDKKMFAEHPEYFALAGGKRMMDQLCWSNPEVEKIMIERLISYCKDYPKVEIINLAAADNMNYCRCEICGLKPVHEVWFNFYNRLVAGVQKAFPKMKFAAIAYQSYKNVPECDLNTTSFVEYCMYDRCYVHRYGQCKMNDKALVNVAKWQTKNIPMLVYGYEFDIFKPTAQAPFYYMVSDQMKKFHAAKIAGVITECSPVNERSKKLPKDAIPGGNYHKLALYLYAATLWDPNVDADAVIKEYSEAAYGSGAPAMAKYAMLMGKSWDNMKNHYSYFYNSPFGCSENLLNGKLISEIDALFRSAAAEIKKSSDAAERTRISANFTEEQKIFNVWKSHYRNFIASKASIKLPVVRSKKPLDFSNCNVVDKFITLRGAKAPKPWQLRMNHDNTALYLDVVGMDDDMKNIIARHTKHDNTVYNDDCIEIFIAVPNDTRGIYRHLIANANGVKYDTVALGGFTFDKAWNPDWLVKAEKKSDRWHLQIAIPFASLDAAPPKAGDVWPFAIKRSNGGRKFSNSGFPDAVYHDQNAFGMIQFTDQLETVPAVFAAPKSNEKALGEIRTLMEKEGFDTAMLNDMKDIENIGSDRKIYIFRHTYATRYNAGFFRNKVLPALENGALVIISGWGNMPLEKYFNNPKLKIKWMGWKNHRGRKSFNVKDGDWLKVPCNIESLVKRGMTPASAFQVLFPEVWNELAQLKTADEQFATFLMTTKVGKGMLVLTSADFGLSGGLAMFGNNKGQTVKLLRNLYQLSKTGK